MSITTHQVFISTAVLTSTSKRPILFTLDKQAERNPNMNPNISQNIELWFQIFLNNYNSSVKVKEKTAVKYIGHRLQHQIFQSILIKQNINYLLPEITCFNPCD